MSNYSGNAWLDALIEKMPDYPRQLTRDYLARIVARANKRIAALSGRANDIKDGRTSPDASQVSIGSGRRYTLAILFLDICSFTSWPSSSHREQELVLAVLNVFMAEMMNVVRDYDGIFEKNTGDGLMAYFGTDASSELESVRAAVDCAVVMHYINDNLITPWCCKAKIWPVRFRIGIDFGDVTVARVGVAGGLNSFVVIGTSANIACRLLDKVSAGEICIGNEVFCRLPKNWIYSCSPLTPDTGFEYVHSQAPYPIWKLSYRPSHPVL